MLKFLVKVEHLRLKFLVKVEHPMLKFLVKVEHPVLKFLVKVKHLRLKFLVKVEHPMLKFLLKVLLMNRYVNSFWLQYFSELYKSHYSSESSLNISIVCTCVY